ncbi:ABC transporter permease [Acuticoccus sp. MNP-M23]|uniref:ABC transporter permease n=1 Tax=Acuticoccus sp. MNP-M23 TaxID=3072793 RepID=UPI002815FDBD|nr:ABC transporter permease [Acuticoccus sp. MNP-M23]WMS43848.1 ABC transporter permease [Acuticoccus sp. MNP-M23]
MTAVADASPHRADKPSPRRYFGWLGSAAILACGPLILIAFWWVAYAGNLVDANLLPSPFATLRDTWTNIVSGNMLYDVWFTFIRVFYAFLFAAIAGVPVGIVLGVNQKVYRSVEFIIDFFRSTPATAMFPLFLLLFGLGDFSKIAVAGFAAWLIVIFNVSYGVMNARRTRILAARSMGASRLRIFFDVVFFETLPQIFVGLRNGISIALVVIIVAEMFIGATDGLGHRIIDAQISYELTDMYGSILVAGALGYGLNAFFLVAEKYLVHWSGK